MITIKCDHCGRTAPYKNAADNGWILLSEDRDNHHFCAIDCVLFWGAKQERTLK